MLINRNSFGRSIQEIAKTISEADTEWPKSLQPAVLSANSHKERSTGYSPFYLMFRCENLPLLRYMNSKVDSDEEGIDESEEISSWNVELEQNRAIDRDNARSNIQIEQAKQKRSYDLKVETKRL